MIKSAKHRLINSVVIIIVVPFLICSCSYKTIIGKTYINYNLIPCTLVECDCCNECGSSIYFIVGIDTLLLSGNPDGQAIECKGNECDVRDSTMHCKPFEIGKKYELKGKLIKKRMKNDVDLFYVNSFKLAE